MKATSLGEGRGGQKEHGAGGGENKLRIPLPADRLRNEDARVYLNFRETATVLHVRGNV